MSRHLENVVGVGIAGGLRQKDLAVGKEKDIKAKKRVNEDEGAYQSFEGKFTP